MYWAALLKWASGVVGADPFLLVFDMILTTEHTDE
jgi:hypothetical protein